MERHNPRAAELRIPDRYHPGGEVDIVPLQSDGLADPQT
jgi:hypothetical protein